MSLKLQLDRNSNRPLYQQIVEQIKRQISDGHLPEGTRLPPVRSLAVQLGVTRLTVHTAYSELQAGGWVDGVVGKGTFVSRSADPDDLIQQFGLRLDTQSMLENMHSLQTSDMVRTLAYTDPDPNLFPATDFWDSIASLRPYAAQLMQYSSCQGETTLRIELTNLLRERGIETMPDELILTTGVTQAISLVARALTAPGDKVLVTQPTYFLLLHILKTEHLHPLSVPMDAEGPDLEALEQRLIAERPRFFYTIPNFSNPTGAVMSPQRRRDLLALAQRYGLVIVEDDIYGHLAYDNPAPQALKALDEAGLVIYMSSFSKVLLPGIRVGYLMMPAPLRERLWKLKLASDIFSPTFIQRALADFLQRGR
ncbi:MAG: PLP-dependent aminotransferase family protein, partial [Anaerolineae bacterium]|nr:PLP-dependent aminotransferase family protein [Anaerolineae bacterium]